MHEDEGRSSKNNHQLVNRSFEINTKKVNLGGIDFVYFEVDQGVETLVLIDGFAANKSN